ncbi:MAG: phenylacetate--CoA ligase [Clostridiales bacterium]|nr:phenylacetate--CoA ligase [Clostridiales bacterium]
MAFFNKHEETMSSDEMSSLQTERLKKTVRRAYENVMPYRAKMDAAGVKPEDIKSVDDLAKLPFTTKQDLRDNYPYGMNAVPMSDVVRIHASSGTSGKQTVVTYTQRDLDVWAECVARVLACAGATKDDIVQVCYGYSMFTGGLGAHYGAEKLGCSVIPASTGNTARQILMMQDFGTTVLCCTPSYAIYLYEHMRDNNISMNSVNLKYGIFGAEPWSDNMRTQIENFLNLTATDIYGLSEICGPGVAFSCQTHKDLHVNEDHFIVEVVDPVTGLRQPDGVPGEVCFTCINKEAMPLIRYNTRDISALHRGKCDCGRTLIRMDRITGRSDDMLIIRGVNVFPSQIESVLLSSGNVDPRYLIIVDRQGTLDQMEIKVEINSSQFTDQIRGLQALENSIKAELDSALNISAKITLVEPGTIERSVGKTKHVIDNRRLD